MTFPHDRFADHDRVVWQHETAHGQPVDRRSRDDAHFAHTGERHLQRPRDRCRGQRQYVNVGAQFLQFFLLGNAEMLFFIDDDQPQPLKLDGVAQQGMGADDDVHRAICEFGADLIRILTGDKARQLAHADRQSLEPFDEVFVMLPGEQCRRDDDGDLESLHRGCKRGAQRDFGLPETDIAAHQPIHRPARRDIGKDVGDGV